MKQFQKTDEYLRRLPVNLRERCREITALIDEFCEQESFEEFRDFAREITLRLCREHAPVLRGKAASWAGGIAQALARANDLSSPDFSPFLRIEDVAEQLGVSPSTVRTKARAVCETLDISPSNPEWRLKQIEIQELKHYKSDRDVIARIRPGGIVEAEAAGLASTENQEPLGPLLSALDDLLAMPRPEPPKPKRRRDAAKVHVLKISLKDAKPSIFRRVAVKSNIKLSDLHHVIQSVMGWYDGHLHEFETRTGMRYGLDAPELGMENVADEMRYRLHDLVERKRDWFTYTYDFGDAWEHRIELVKIEAPAPGVKYPICLGGKRACPPEDCGGIQAYYEMLEALEHRSSEMYEEDGEWLPDDFDPDVFDVEIANQRLAYSFR